MPVIPQQTEEQRARALADAGFATDTFAPGATPAPISRTIDPNVAAAESYLGTFKQPETADQIAERKRQQSASLIDSINKTYDDEVANSRKAGTERVAMDNAISVLSGLTGSTEAVRTRTNVNAANDKEIAAINNKRGLDLARVYTQISADADREAREQLTDATKNAEDILARRIAAQGKAAENLKLMASSGLVDFDSFKASPQNAKVYQYALDSVDGSEEALRAMFMLNRPKDQIIGTPTRVGNKYVQAYQKADGTVKYESVDLPFDLPDTYSKFEKLGDNLVAVPDNWDGDVSKLRTVAGAPSTMEMLQRQSLALDIQKKQTELGSGSSAQAMQQKTETLQLAKELRKADAVGKGSAVGASAAKLVPFGQALGLQGNRTAFEAKVNTLKSNLTLENLKLLKGAMSDKDLLFLNAIGSSLDTNMSESAFDAELDRVIAKLQETTGTGGGGTVVTAPDGTEIELID